MTLVNRWYQILQYFITRDQLTMSELKSITQASTQTVKKNLQLLNDQLDHIAKIVENNQVYSLQIIDEDQFDEVINGSLKQKTDFNSALKRIAFLIDQFMKTNDYLVIDDLAEQLGVSRSTINKDLKKLKKLLLSYNISLIGTPNKGLLLKGNEVDLRILYLYHAYDYLAQPTLPSKVLQGIQQVGINKKLDVRTVGLLVKVINITLQRVHLGCSLTEPILYYQNYFRDSSAIEELLVTIETTSNVTLSYYDFDFICFPLNLFNNEVVPEERADNQVVTQLYHYMLKEMHQAIIFSIDELELFKKLKGHFMFLINRIIFRVSTIDIFGEDLQRKYAFSYELAELGITALARFLNKPELKNEISYLSIYFELMLKEADQQAPKEIAVVCNTGKGTALMIKRQLANVLGPDIQISHYSEEEYETKDLDRFFVIFTTIPLKHTKATTSVIRLTDLFNDNWLLSEWKKIIAEKSVSFDNFQFNFTTLTTGDDYQTSLQIMLAQLKEKQLVNQEFTNYIIKKSQEDSAVIDNGIAFPHGINTRLDQVIVSIGSYPTKATQKIELIFLVAIPEKLTANLEEELLSFYDTMFKVAASQTLRALMKKVSSKAAYKSVVTKGRLE